MITCLFFFLVCSYGQYPRLCNHRFHLGPKHLTIQIKLPSCWGAAPPSCRPPLRCPCNGQSVFWLCGCVPIVPVGGIIQWVALRVWLLPLSVFSDSSVLWHVPALQPLVWLNDTSLDVCAAVVGPVACWQTLRLCPSSGYCEQLCSGCLLAPRFQSSGCPARSGTVTW